jgi:hypothetical protein
LMYHAHRKLNEGGRDGQPNARTTTELLLERKL